MKCAATIALVVVLCAGRAGAQQKPQDVHRLADESFRQAQAAFTRGDYAAAAAAFEQAARVAPHPSAWLNAAEAWELAGQPVRAAEDCDEVLSMTDLEERYSAEAKRRLARLEPKLARLEIRGASPATSRIDGGAELALPARRRLVPGRHVLTIVDGPASAPRRIDVDLAPGESRSVDAAGAPPPDQPRAVARPLASPAAPPPPPPPRSDPSGPAIPVGSWIAFGVAGVSAGIAGVFGAMTVSAYNDFNDAPSQESNDDFHRDKLVTNVCVGVAATAAAVGVIVALTAGRPRGGAAARISSTWPASAFVRF